MHEPHPLFRLIACVTAGALTLSVGCSGLPPTPPAPQDDQAFSDPVSIELEGVKHDPAAPLVLMPGDVVMLHAVSAETTEYKGLIVDDRGYLHIPLAGDVQVGGLTLTQAEAKVQEALRKYDTVVRAVLFLEDAQGHRASVLGAVGAPGRVVVTPGTRLADLLAAAGGVLKEARDGDAAVLGDLSGARLVRQGRVLPVSLERALMADPRHNIRVRSGDHLYVPPLRGRRISVLGEVREPKALPYYSGLRLTQALAVAGGITIDGDRADVRVIRGSFRQPKVYTTSMVQIVNGESHDVVLAPGDVVFVTEHWIASVGEVLDRLSPLMSLGVTVGLGFAVTR